MASQSLRCPGGMEKNGKGVVSGLSIPPGRHPHITTPPRPIHRRSRLRRASQPPACRADISLCRETPRAWLPEALCLQKPGGALGVGTAAQSQEALGVRWREPGSNSVLVLSPFSSGEESLPLTSSHLILSPFFSPASSPRIPLLSRPAGTPCNLRNPSLCNASMEQAQMTGTNISPESPTVQVRKGAGKGELLLTNPQPAGVFGLHTALPGLPPRTGTREGEKRVSPHRPPSPGIKEMETHLGELSRECAGTCGSSAKAEGALPSDR